MAATKSDKGGHGGNRRNSGSSIDLLPCGTNSETPHFPHSLPPLGHFPTLGHSLRSSLRSGHSLVPLCHSLNSVSQKISRKSANLYYSLINKSYNYKSYL